MSEICDPLRYGLPEPPELSDGELKAILPRPGLTREGKRWGENELASLRFCWPTLTTLEALEEYAYARHRRSAAAVRDKARRIGLSTDHLPRATAGVKRSVYQRWTAEEARAEFDAFLASGECVGRYCAQQGHSAIMWAKAIRQQVPAEEWQAAVEMNWPSKTHYFKAVREHEAPVAKMLRKLGYDAERTYRSRTAIDVRAVPPVGSGLPTLYIQCKDGGVLPPGEWNAVYDFAARFGAVPIASERKDGTIHFWRLDARKERKRNYPQPWTSVEITENGLVEAHHSQPWPPP